MLAFVATFGCGWFASRLLFWLEQDDVLSRIELRPLEAADIRELAERVLGRPSTPPALVWWLFDESQGNPLFAVNLLDALLEEGADLVDRLDNGSTIPLLRQRALAGLPWVV